MFQNKLNNTYSTISTKDTIFDTFTTQSSPITTTHKQEMTCDKYHNYTLKRDDGIFQHLPIDILKNVHSTLKSQPVSYEGKLHFLKMFEKSLMSEIGKIFSYIFLHIHIYIVKQYDFLKVFIFLFIATESRLTATMSPNRKVRGADYHGHGYESHDDHSIGFPSIEGALLAISFLTFAVYLVRLVMVRNIFLRIIFSSFLKYPKQAFTLYFFLYFIYLSLSVFFGMLLNNILQLLFRNMSTPMTTTTAGALFLGKRKRSIDFDDDTARILNII